LHNDLKANNVLLEQDNEKEFSPKIVDFGKSRLINKPRQRKRLFTSLYLAPEVRAGHTETTASDIYSLEAVVSKRRFGECFSSLIEQITASSRRNRLSVREILSHLNTL
jgi:serine/threonine protein kinase